MDQPIQGRLPVVASVDYFASICADLALDCLSCGGWPDGFGKALRAADFGGGRPRALSLFSGGGGLDIGFHDAGFEIHTMVEIEERYAATLEANSGSAESPLGEARPAQTDIRLFSSAGLPHIDFIIGGPPCQTFSAAGRRAHGVLGVDDPRGVLFEEYIRLLGELQPVGFLFENVYGIVGAQGGEPWRLIVESFEAAGYTLSHRILDSADYGVPQHRERLIIVGWRAGDHFRFPRPTHGPDSASSRPHYSALEALAGLKTELDVSDSLGGRYGPLLTEVPPGLNYSYFTQKMGHPRPVFAWRSKFSDFLYKADPDAPVRTIKAKGGQYTGPFHWDNRPFSTAELKRLQTFPDEYELRGNRATVIEQIGNSVPPQFARILALAVREQLFGQSLGTGFETLEPSEKLSFRKLKRLRTNQYLAKAKQAIAELDAPAPPAAPSQIADRYRANLGDGFKLIRDVSGPLKVDISSNGRWAIGITDCEGALGEFEILIHPASPSGWPASGRSFELHGTLSERSFTASWKALEQALARHEHLADLVQLNGYYQYEPKLQAKMVHDGDDNRWHILSSVVAGHGVRSTTTTETLAFTWGVPPTEVEAACAFLRGLGYEVRNSNTNPQIPPGSWLIPYAFPTLTSQSVQFRKSLTATNA